MQRPGLASAAPLTHRVKTLALCTGLSALLTGGACRATDVVSGGSDKPDKLTVAWSVPFFNPASDIFIGTPAVDAGTLFIEDGNEVVAVDANTGVKRWSRPVRVNPVPAAEVILAKDGKVYISEVDSVLAMSAADGTTIWNFRPDKAAAGVYASLDDRALYTGQREIPVVYALSLTDGRLLWKTNIGPDWQYPGFVVGTAVSGDTVYVAGRRYLAQNGYIAKGILVALDRNDGRELWRYESSGPGNLSGLQGAPVVAGQYLVVSDLNGQAFFAYDRFALREVWRIQSTDRNGPLTPPVVVGNRVYVGSADTNAYAVDLNTGAVIWKQNLGGSLYGTAYCAGSVFINANVNLQRRDTAAGRYTGAFNPGNNRRFSSNIVSDGVRVYLMGAGGTTAVNCR